MATPTNETARLWAVAPKLLARLKESTKELIADRDAFYECCSDPHGDVTDEGDRQELARLDAIIDANRAVIAKAEGVQS